MNCDQLTIEFLGTGTSTGVPQIGCQCAVCRSTDPRDKRLRASAIVTYRGKRLLIDCGPDFRQQILSASNWQLDALLLTHNHFDHIGGIEDLRVHSARGTFPIYARPDVITSLRERLPYCFSAHHYPGAPVLNILPIADQPFEVCGIEVTPIPVMHNMPIVGFKIGPMAYITDAKSICPAVVDSLKGVRLLVINALRIEPHPTHMSLSECLDVVRRINPDRTYLIHMSHGIGLHDEVSRNLPSGVELAYDGLKVTL